MCGKDTKKCYWWGYLQQIFHFAQIISFLIGGKRCEVDMGINIHRW